MHSRFLHSFMLLALIFLSSVQAQTNFPEIEPNGQKTQATVVIGIAAGDTITGVTTGAGTTLGDTALTSADVFRVKTTPLPLGIYRHTLTLTSTPVAGQTGTIRGLNQVNGVIGSTDVAVQPTSPNVWYAFGKQEELYYRVTGIATTTGAYTATLTTSTITPTVIAGTFNPGPITVASAQGQTTDAEIFIYDGNLNPVPMGHNDNPIAPLSGPNCFVTVNLAPGTYFVAISRFNTANDQSDAHPNEVFLNENVLEFPNAIVNNTQIGFAPLTYTVTDGVTFTVVPAIVNAFNIEWGTFTVHLNTMTTSFCLGDGTGSACPCANTGAAGNGCANASFGAGAHLAATGTAGASAGTDTLVLTASDVPGPGLFIQATGQAAGGAGAAFGDGLLCLSGAIVRLGVVLPTGSAASYPSGSSAPMPIHLGGGTTAGDVRHYQCWYRDALPFCSADTFNLTQGLTLIWSP